MKKRYNKILSVIICFIVTYVVFSAPLFIVKNIDHNCTGDDCSICAAIVQCENAVKAIGSAASGKINVISAVAVFLIVIAALILFEKRSTTLVTLKVELLS